MAVALSDQLWSLEGLVERDRDDAMQFNIGDVVSLKSGGPEMTVESVNDPEIICVWFERQKYHRKTFRREMLQEGSGSRGITVIFEGVDDPTN